MTPIEDKLKAIEELCEAATDGPWSAREVEGLIPSIRNAHQKNIAHISGGDEKHSSNTAQFIAQSRDLVPRLVRALRIAIAILNDDAALMKQTREDSGLHLGGISLVEQSLEQIEQILNGGDSE